MQRMLLPTAHSLTRRAVAGVLGLWLCVVAAGVWAPMARASLAAQGMERLCSGHGAAQWVHSPVAADHSADAAELHHLIDCPLCLPVLAPPPQGCSPSQPAILSFAPVVTALALPVAGALPWPPARGPPQYLLTLK